MRFTFTFYVGRKTITLSIVVKARTATRPVTVLRSNLITLSLKETNRLSQCLFYTYYNAVLSLCQAATCRLSAA